MGIREPIKDFYGKVIGYIETLADGDKIARDFYGKILGYYRKELNITTDYYGRKLSSGDTAVGLIWQLYNNKK